MARTCSAGHETPGEGDFCGTCGEHLAEPTPSGWACPLGHANENTHQFCTTCGAPRVAGDGSASATNRSRYLGIAAVALIAVVFGTIAYFVVRGSGGDEETGTEATTTTLGEPEVTITNAGLCNIELSGWAEYATSQPDALRVPMLQYGTQSPSFKILSDAIIAFQLNQPKIGRADASALAHEVIRDGCNELGDAFEPGELAPN